MKRRSPSRRKRPQRQPRTGTGTTATPRSEAAHRFALGLGANLGPVVAALRAALGQLEDTFAPLEVASLYRSPAVSPIPQPDFLNTAVIATTRLEPEAVLALAKQIELAAGRRPAERWAPRRLDVDLLLFGDRSSQRPELTLPHPRLAVRRFVLAPLAEIAPDWPVPPTGATVAELLAGLAPEPTTERLAWPET